MPCSVEAQQSYIMADSLFIFTLVLSSFSVLGNIRNPICKPVGTKLITISWKFSTAQAGKPPLAFHVYFCKKDCFNTSVNYHLGCALNVTEKKSEYSCNIGKALDLQFPQESSFNFYVKEDNGPPVIGRCPVNIKIQCPKPTGLELKPSGRGKLKLSWSAPTDMGRSNMFLCYFITYFSEESPDNKKTQKYPDEGKFQYEIGSLLPYRKYHVLLKCALNCVQKKSVAAGPVNATTLEEEPEDRVIFQDWINKPVDHYTRNVTLFFTIPDKEKWNGKVTRIRLFCYRYEHLCTNITLEELFPHGWKYNVTFPFLRKDMEYHVKADYCNSVGCSPPSRNHTILPLPTEAAVAVENPAEPKESLTTGELVGIIVGTCLAALLVIIAIVLRKCYCNTEPRASLEKHVGSVSPSSSEHHERDLPEDHSNGVYSRADGPVPRRTTLNPETTDFQSASVRSINSFNSIGGQTDQSTVREDPASIGDNEEGSNEESARLLQRCGSPSVENRPSHEDDNPLSTPV